MAKRKTIAEIEERIRHRQAESMQELSVGQPHRQSRAPTLLVCRCGAPMRVEIERDHDLIVQRYVCVNGHAIYAPSGVDNGS